MRRDRENRAPDKRLERVILYWTRSAYPIRACGR
jgi:hypothetical protein